MLYRHSGFESIPIPNFWCSCEVPPCSVVGYHLGQHRPELVFPHDADQGRPVQGNSNTTGQHRFPGLQILETVTMVLYPAKKNRGCPLSWDFPRRRSLVQTRSALIRVSAGP
jgi:hypothetical protein